MHGLLADRGRGLLVGVATAALAAALWLVGAFGYVGAAVAGPGSGAAKQQYPDVRPGWGCGDTNHVHTGPPGQPGATPPPGCTQYSGRP